MKFQAINGLIAVRMDPAIQAIGRFVLPASAKEEVETGTVVSASRTVFGENDEVRENPVKDGDRILLAKGSGVKVEVMGEELVLITLNEVTGIIHDE